jgi:hypothetical protein
MSSTGLTSSRTTEISSSKVCFLGHEPDAERSSAPPNNLASLSRECVRHRRKPKSTSDGRINVSDDLRAVQRHIQHLTLVAHKVIVECDPRGLLPRSSGFALVLRNKHAMVLARCGDPFLASKCQNPLRAVNTLFTIFVHLNSVRCVGHVCGFKSRHRSSRWRLLIAAFAGDVE